MVSRHFPPNLLFLISFYSSPFTSPSPFNNPAGSGHRLGQVVRSVDNLHHSLKYTPTLLFVHSPFSENTVKERERFECVVLDLEFPPHNPHRTMRFSLPNRTHNSMSSSLSSSLFLIFSLISLSLLHSAEAIRVIGSRSLATCMDNSGIGATTFDVSFTPDNSSFAFNIDGVSTISGNVTGISIPTTGLD